MMGRVLKTKKRFGFTDNSVFVCLFGLCMCLGGSCDCVMWGNNNRENVFLFRPLFRYPFGIAFRIVDYDPYTTFSLLSL